MKLPLVRRAVLTLVGLLVITDSSQAFSILVDFGNPATVTKHVSLGGTDPNNFWNNVTSVTPLVDPLVLVDTTNTPTGITLQITSRFNGVNTDGTLSGSAPYVTTATQESFYGNTEVFQGLSTPNPSVLLSGLDPESVYSFRFYASRMGVSDNRGTDYFVSGSVSGQATLNAASNIDNSAIVTGIRPDDFGNIQITLAESADNNNANSFIYLGVMEIVAVPEPGSASLLMLAGATVLGLRRRRSA